MAQEFALALFGSIQSIFGGWCSLVLHLSSRKVV